MISDQESAAAMVPAAENNSARPSAVVETPEGNNLGVDGYDVGLMDDLLSALSSIKTPGSFASFGVLPQPPPAGLFVDNVGDITMPLSEVQARQLIAKARQAPYGKGSATIVDTAVRKTWELDSGQFRFQSPHWPGFMRHLCAQVALNLGINAPIAAQIYKMLIYEKGAMFKAHTDTEKIPGMFGTLVVCLPSAHQGGEVVLKHCGQKKVFKTSEAPQSFASWYSDVSHEVLPVTSGFRWVLTYNLALHLTGPGPSAGLQQFETGALRRTLKRWLSEPKESRETNCVYHVLDHDYTEANISLKALKTRDLAQVHALKEISGELAVDVFLALLEKKEMGMCEYDPDEDRYDGYRRYNRSYYNDYNDDESSHHYIEEVLDTSYAVKTLVDLEGHVVTTRLRLDEQDILQEDCFEDLEEAKEEYEGSGIWPEHVCNHSTPQSFVNALVMLSKQAWNIRRKTIGGFGAQEPWIDGDGIRDVLTAAIQHGKYNFLQEAAGHHEGLLPPDFFVWVRQWLLTGDSNTNERFNVIQSGISSAISSYPYFADQFTAITKLVPMSNDALTPDTAATPDYILDWARGKLRSCMDACASESLGREDGPAMVDLALFFNDPPTFMSQIILPRIDQRHDAAAFFLAFLARLRQQSKNGILPMGNAIQFYQAKARYFITLADFTQMRGDAGGQAIPTKKTPHNCEQAQKLDRRTAISYEVLADFFSAIIQSSTEADDLVTLFVSKLVVKAQQLPALEFHALWLPFLRRLIPILVSNTIPLDNPYCQQLFSALLHAYVNKYVGHKPTEKTSLIRPGVRCQCSDCQWLNRFLAGTERVGRFSVNKKRRMHLHQQLDSGGVDCTHETWRSGSPQTLVVTKTFRHNEKRLLDWKSRLMLAKEQIRKFEPLHLSLLLGPNYLTIVNMEHLSAAPERAQGQSPAVVSGSSRAADQPRGPLQAISSTRLRQSPVAGVKRKLPPTEIDIIDLTGE
ncbi:2OG-Fe(II) oxygenase superfamily protein [Metarhizium robertsii ARSEF 23]|uniref:2OG-Fe(II) oxygenase superfamily protein n=1 Tax=Metarhizium robertsii (strain ARSEF 23 / ATCC MYA-3075) TaxID=655844 RepID=E9F9A2_METRA|nr:2OG-Fe(II) oxygenase superfamily protein [Metarhizium robertsii ARSEF 23]EFY95707.1 2OG-Fe(II) oxygenase superfamily protein [Metarhizium robertsii ARSEF 23]